MGNRFENLQRAVDSVFEKIGSIVKISSVYETPAMGFEGDPFLNCAVWIQTDFKPSKILKVALEIEKSLGRERNTSKTYTSRPIDIDIIFIDDLVIKTEKLTVPHSEMEKRKFVLQPLAELNSGFIHPISTKKYN